MLSCLPGGQRWLHALRQGAGGGGFIELVLWSGQRSQHAHWNSTNTTMKHPPRNLKNCRATQSWASSYFSLEWRSNWHSQWSGDPSSAARFQPSQTGPSNLPAEPTDAPPPETGQKEDDGGGNYVLPHPLNRAELVIQRGASANTEIQPYRRIGSAYLRLSFGILQDCHRVRVGNGMAHNSWTKNTGQVTDVHPSFHTVGNSVRSQHLFSHVSSACARWSIQY